MFEQDSMNKDELNVDHYLSNSDISSHGWGSAMNVDCGRPLAASAEKMWGGGVETLPSSVCHISWWLQEPQWARCLWPELCPQLFPFKLWVFHVISDAGFLNLRKLSMFADNSSETWLVIRILLDAFTNKDSWISSLEILTQWSSYNFTSCVFKSFPDILA